jgi:ribosome-binding factor A
MPKRKAQPPTEASKVADQIQRDLSGADRARDQGSAPGHGDHQRVDVTPDYAHAKVFFSVLVGDPMETEEALNKAAGFLRNGLFKRLHIHTVPTLHFQFDRTTERAADMNALIARAVASRSKDSDQNRP